MSVNIAEAVRDTLAAFQAHVHTSRAADAVVYWIHWYNACVTEHHIDKKDVIRIGDTHWFWDGKRTATRVYISGAHDVVPDTMRAIEGMTQALRAAEIYDNFPWPLFYWYMCYNEFATRPVRAGDTVQLGDRTWLVMDGPEFTAHQTAVQT